MKRAYRSYFILSLSIFIFSCKHKTTHDEELNYYLKISFQIKEVSNLVRSFSPQLLAAIKQYPLASKDNKGQLDSLRNSFSALMLQLDERLVTLDELKPVNHEILIKLSATKFVKDTRNILINFHRLLLNRYVAQDYKLKVMTLEEIKSGKKYLDLDDFYYEKRFDEYRKKYHLSDNELAAYGL